MDDPLVMGASAAERRTAKPMFHPFEVDFGDVVLRAGEQNSALVLVREGELALYAAEIEVAQVRAGEVVGVMGAFVEPLMLHEVRAIRPSKLLVIEAGDYEQLRKQSPVIAANLERMVLDSLTRRMRNSEERVQTYIGRPAPEPRQTPPVPIFEQLGSLLGAALDFSDPTVEVREALRGSSLFDASEPGPLSALAAEFEVASYRKGEPVFAPLATSDALYLVVQGTVELHITPHDDVVPLSVQGAGCLVGASHVIDGAPRTALAVAGDQTVLASISRERWQEISGSHTELGSLLRRAAIRSLLDLASVVETAVITWQGTHIERTRAEIAELYPAQGPWKI